MKIENVNITNHSGTADWWDDVKKRPDEPLIKADISMLISYYEYQSILDQDNDRKKASREYAAVAKEVTKEQAIDVIKYMKETKPEGWEEEVKRLLKILSKIDDRTVHVATSESVGRKHVRVSNRPIRDDFSEQSLP